MSDQELTDEEILELEGKVGGRRGAPRKAKNFSRSVARMLGLLGPYRFTILGVVIIVALSVLANVSGPLLSGRAVDVIYRGATTPDPIDFSLLGKLIAGVIGLYVIAGGLQLLQGRIINRVTARVVYQLRRDIQERVHRLPLAYFDRSSRGDVLSRTTNDVDNMQQALQQSITRLISATLMLIGITVMMFTVSWRLALVALTALPVTAVIVAIVGKYSHRRFSAQWRATGELNGHVEESFGGHEVLHIFGRRQASEEQFAEHNERLFTAASAAAFLSGLMSPVMQFISYLSYVAIAVFGGLLVAQGRITLGAATAFIQYSRQFNQPLGEIGGIIQMLQSGVASAERVFELLDTPAEPADTPGIRRSPDTAPRGAEDGKSRQLAPQIRGRVEFKDVSFSYDPDVPLIRDLNLTVAPGSTVAIVGPTGAGKSTLVNLLLRFYDVDSGSITLDGVDIRHLPREELRSGMGMVLQDAQLFDGTITDNIRYGNLTATDEQVRAAARAAYVDHFAHTLAAGYDTRLDADGGELSAGQRQLVTIARAFVREPAVLILDEATSSVDTRTELLVQHAMERLRAGRTAFVIAHRLSTIRDADLILVMEDGQIVEQGTHSELLERGGAYARLHDAQAQHGE